MIKLPFGKKFRKTKVEIPEFQTINVKDIIAPASIRATADHLQLGERFAKTFFIFSYPRYITTGWFSPIINLDVPMDISFFIHPANTTKTLKQLRQRITATQAEMMEREEKGFIRSPELEIAYRDMEALRDRLQSAQEKMFSFGLYLTIYADDKQKLKDVQTTLRSILEGRLIFIKPAVYQQEGGFVSTSPYGLDRLLVHTPMNTGPLSSIFPFISFDLSSNQGILYGINQHNNSLVLFDRFSMPSYNEVLFGSSGCGKSIKGSESVLIRKSGKIQLVKIGPLIEDLIKKHGASKIDEEMEGVVNPGLEIFAFDKNLKGKWSKATVAARKEASKTFYKFITKSGREVTTTEDHNMLILKQGKVVAARSSEIKKGECIPLPRFIPESKHSLESFNLLKLLKNTKGIYVLGGKKLIRENYKNLKKVNLDRKLDQYLYKYRSGQRVSIQYFWKILDFLGIKPEDPELEQIKVISKNGKGFLKTKLPVTAPLLRILGLITAEGTIGDTFIKISNRNPEIVEKMGKDLDELKVPFSRTDKGIDVGIKVFAELIKSLAGKQKAGEKRVPPFIFTLNKKEIAHYLSAYFEGDGTIGSNGTISATSKSKELISDLSYLLYKFGIIGRIRTKFSRATNSNHRGDYYYQIDISGQKQLERFFKDIGFMTEKKNCRLKKFLGRKHGNNVDFIPGLAPIFKEIYQLFGFQLYGISGMPEWRRKQGNPSPERLKTVIKEIEGRIEEFKNLESTFKVLKELPELTEIIEIGKNNKELNQKLWQALGSSWAWMRKEVRPFAQNAFETIKTVEDKNYSLNEIKGKIHLGFKEMNISVKDYNPSLQSALVYRLKSNTSYGTIQKTAHFVWQNYQRILNQDIPQVEKRLDQLKILADSNLFWDPIVKVEKSKNKTEKYVYDLTVDNEVFLAGLGGMFVHNSFLVKLEILRSLMSGHDVIVLDPENEYQFLTEATGGSFVNISLTSPHHVNPFDLPAPREDEDPENVLRSNIINLVGLMRIMLGGLTPEEDAIIDAALTETYRARDITPESDPETWTENTPLMSDLESVLETMEGAESLARRLKKYTSGTYSSFFNQPTNISLKKKFVVFGIRDMEEELKQLAMFIIMRYIWKEIASELKKRILVIDEAWWMMQTEDGASFLYGLAKRARKYWLGVTTITQDVNDFMKSEYGQPIVANSSIQILMKQSPATAKVIQETFNLTEEEKLRLLEASVGEGLFFAGTKHVAISVVASYTEDQIITTTPEEVVKIKEAKKQLST